MFFKDIEKQPPAVQKQSPVEFCKKNVFLKILQTSHETPVLESFFNNIAGLQSASFLKRDSNTSAFL